MQVKRNHVDCIWVMIGARSMEAMNEKRRPGRKPKGGEKLEQFSIRLPPRLKFGLELLARLQGRSLSQSVEWALQSALMHVKLTPPEGPISLWATACVAWDIEPRWARWMALFRCDPQLVPFEERHACRIIDSCKDWEFIASQGDELRDDLMSQWSDLIDLSWDRLVDDSADLLIMDDVAGGQEPLLVALGFLPQDESGLPIPKLIAKAHAQAFAAKLEEHTEKKLADLRGFGARISPPESPLSRPKAKARKTAR